MPFKINISEKGISYKLEVESESILNKKIGDKIDGKEIRSDLAGFEFEMTGASDKAGFPVKKGLEGVGLRRVLLKKGFAMKDNYPGIKRRKTVRADQITPDVVQINLDVKKKGEKKLEELFPEQVKAREDKKKARDEKIKAAKNPAPKTEAQPAA